MAVRSKNLTIGTTPVALVTGQDADFNPNYRDIAVTNSSDATVYLGGPDVTTTNGFPLPVGASLSFDQVAADAIPYAIVATGTATLSVLELGV